MKELLIDMITLKFVPCHRKPERSLKIKGKQFPLCARCMSILIGYIAVIPFLFYSFTFPIPLAILLNIPMIIDGYTQLKGWRKSNNGLRTITGLASGVGQAMFIVTSAHFIADFFSK